MRNTTYFFDGQDDIAETMLDKNNSIICVLDILSLKKEFNDIDRRIHDESLDRIWHMKTLEENWDSYNGSQISENAMINSNLFLATILAAGLFFKRPIVSPEPNGGLLLKWRHGKKEFSCWFTPVKQNCIYLEVCNGERTGAKVESLEELFNVFKKWLNECVA